MAKMKKAGLVLQLLELFESSKAKLIALLMVLVFAVTMSLVGCAGTVNLEACYEEDGVMVCGDLETNWSEDGEDSK